MEERPHIFPKLLSHRAKGFDRSDSSVVGIAAALQQGVKHVEIDLQATSDGVLVAHHDPSS
jgi:glycerophosphoryl diester phosphodiesterase